MREYIQNTGIPACAPSGVALRCQDKSNRAGITPSSGLQTRWATGQRPVFHRTLVMAGAG